MRAIHELGRQCARNFVAADLLGLARALRDPGLGLLKALVEQEEAGLTAALDELIGLGDELFGEHPARELAVGGERAGGRVPGDLGDARGRVDKVGRDRRGLRDRRRTLEPVGEEEFGVVFADGYNQSLCSVPKVARLRCSSSRTFGGHDGRRLESNPDEIRVYILLSGSCGGWEARSSQQRPQGEQRGRLYGAGVA